MNIKHLSTIALASILTLVSCSKSLAPLNETVTIDGAVGKLVGDVVRPEVKGEKCPVAIICHGICGWRTEDHLAVVADSLLANGIAVVRFDYDGHGESEGALVDMTIDKEIDDTKCIYDYVASISWVDTNNIAIVGHSQGGVVTGITAGDLGKDKIKCLTLLAPGAVVVTNAKAGKLFGVEFTEGNWPDSLYVFGEHIGPEYAKSAYYLDAFGRTSKYTGPTCLIQGLADTESLVREAEKYPDYLQNCDFYPLDGLTHCFEEDMATPARITTHFILKNFSMPYDPTALEK